MKHGVGRGKCPDRWRPSHTQGCLRWEVQQVLGAAPHFSPRSPQQHECVLGSIRASQCSRTTTSRTKPPLLSLVSPGTGQPPNPFKWPLAPQGQEMS